METELTATLFLHSRSRRAARHLDFPQLQRFGRLPACGASFFKAGMVSHGFQVNLEVSQLAANRAAATPF